ncbi:hypothetical protein G4B88_002749 [Cannabis sativa]|uniref:Uncharacterized protein n=1 Tax=Cannabis sativa TaxID=3483 RepID=A0A7J6HHY3_CANSA|nr:hypothetical protein G4B88_002749 [Cannabis sativa]
MKNLQTWNQLERHEWGDVFDILKRREMEKKSLWLNLEWDEADRMPLNMFRCFQKSSKFKVFCGGDSVCFSMKRVKRMALWDYCFDSRSYPEHQPPPQSSP